VGTVVVVGSINVDLVVKVEKLPNRGETVIGGTFAQVQGGKGGNQAAAASALGVPTAIIAKVGDDDLGRSAVDDLRARAIDVSGVTMASSPTGVAAILVDASGENLIAVASGANADLTPGDVGSAIASQTADRAVLLTNLEIPDAAVEAASEAAAERGWTSVLNLAPWRLLPQTLVGGFDLVIGNEHEIGTVAEIERMLAAGTRGVIVTRGAAGADLHRTGSDPLTVSAFQTEAVDTTGAGDAFCGGLCTALARGSAIDQAVRWGSAAGALATRGVGARASLPDVSEIEALIRAAGHP
jgi:ribokinase